MAVVKVVLFALGLASGAIGFIPAAPIATRGHVQGTTSTTLGMVAVGGTAPDFTLKNQNGEAVSLSSFRAGEEEEDEGKRVVVFFYPKDYTPGSYTEAQTFQADLPKFKELGAEVIGISSDADHSQIVQENGLTMTLLSDVGGKVRKEWAVNRSLFGAMDGRVTYVLDANGVVTSIYDDLLDHAGHSKEALKALQG